MQTRSSADAPCRYLRRVRPMCRPVPSRLAKSGQRAASATLAFETQGFHPLPVGAARVNLETVGWRSALKSERTHVAEVRARRGGNPRIGSRRRYCSRCRGGYPRGCRRSTHGEREHDRVAPPSTPRAARVQSKQRLLRTRRQQIAFRHAPLAGPNATRESSWQPRRMKQLRSTTSMPSEARLGRKGRQLQLVRPTGFVLGVQIVERLRDLHGVHDDLRVLLGARQGSGSR